MFIKNPESIQCKIFLATDRQHLILQRKGISALSFFNGKWQYRYTEEIKKMIEGGELD